MRRDDQRDFQTGHVAKPDEGTILGHPPGLFLLFLVEMWERFSYYGMRGLLVLYLIAGMYSAKLPGGAEARFATGSTVEVTTANGVEKGKVVRVIEEEHAADNARSLQMSVPLADGTSESRTIPFSAITAITVGPGANPGPGWTRKTASTLYGWYTGLAYLFPIFGGIIADKLIGTHRSMVIGGLLIAIGHIVLGLSGFGTLAHSDVGMSVFVAGLAIIVLGTGHFKPSVSVMVGQLYKQGDPRRDGAFTIFYMGINLGAFLCAFVCGTLGEKVGWHWGFGAAAVGMIAGLVLYTILRPRYLADIGLPPDGRGASAPVFVIVNILLGALCGLVYHYGYLNAFAELLSPLAVGLLATLILGLVIWFVAVQNPEDRGPTASIFLFMAFNVFFWMAFEQAGSSINVFTEQNTNRTLFGREIPATWFQSVNAGLIFTLAPLFAGLWTRLGKHGLDPSQPMKIALGLISLGIGYLFMVWAGVSVKDGAKASMLLIFLTYFWHTIGELCLSPTGLSYVTKVAPKRFVSLLMGVWLVSSFVANLAGGLIAARVEKIERGEITLPWHFGGQADFFFLFVLTSIGVGLGVAIFTPLLKKLIQGRDQNDAPATGH
jgi:POT family proton-dependent oligopeptide transporter